MSGTLNPNAPLITAAISVAPLPINTGTLFTMPTGIQTNSITATAIPTTKVTVVTTAPTTAATTAPTTTGATTAPTTTAATTAPTTKAVTTAPTTTGATTAPTTTAATTAPTTKAVTTAPTTTGATTAPTTSSATTLPTTASGTSAPTTTGAVTTTGSTMAPTASVSASVSQIVATGTNPAIQPVIINDQNVNNNTLITQIIQQQQAIQTALNTTTTTATNPPPPPPPSTPGTPSSTPDNFQVIDEAAKNAFHTPGTPFTGTVAGVQNEYINLNPTNLNITAITPNAFIQSGAGNDALQAYQGRNVLDAGAGSNTIIAGTGQDTILASVSSATTLNTTPIVDLIKNFGAGDDAILRGLTPADFNIKFTDSTGAFGPELLLTATSNTTGGPTATAALAGFSTGDVASGRLSISFSTDPSGQPFLLIHANS